MHNNLFKLFQGRVSWNIYLEFKSKQNWGIAISGMFEAMLKALLFGGPNACFGYLTWEKLILGGMDTWDFLRIIKKTEYIISRDGSVCLKP